MGKLFLHTIVSLDGYIDGPNGELDWRFIDDEFEEYIAHLLHSIDGMLFGRVAYGLLAGCWPTAVENPAAAANPARPERHIEAARLMNALPEYVVSTTLRTTQWNNSHIVGGDITEAISGLKQRSQRALAVFAGAKLASTLTQLGLIDEYRLVLNPALLGGGRRLFTGAYDLVNLRCGRRDRLSPEL